MPKRTTAVRADQQARARLGQVTERVAELGELLRDAPDENQITEQLALLDQLEDAAAKAGEALRAARADRAKGETALGALERAEAQLRAPSCQLPATAWSPWGHPPSTTWACIDAWTD